MKIFLYCFCVVLSLPAMSQTATFPKRGSITIDLHGAYSKEDFRWSIAGNSAGQNPNILSEVIWKNLKGYGIGGAIQMNIWSHFILLGNYHKMFIRSGGVTDTDYAGDNRTDISYYAELNSNAGSAYRYVASLGYLFSFNDRLSIIPLAGYTRSKQSLFMKGFDSEEDHDYALLNSTYKTRWEGFVVGALTNYSFNSILYLEAEFDYKQLNYWAVADWNLIDAFAHPISFKHTGNGFEANLQAKFGVQLSAQISTYIMANYFHAETGKGKDQLFLANGQEQLSQFNGAIRKGLTAGAGLRLTL